jgi:hypothetical protein
MNVSCSLDVITLQLLFKPSNEMAEVTNAQIPGPSRAWRVPAHLLPATAGSPG